MPRTDTLRAALTARDDEIEYYQINIDNYVRALAKIEREHAGDSDMDKAMQDFAVRLRDLLSSSLVEQRKAQIIRDVIAEQLEG